MAQNLPEIERLPNFGDKMDKTSLQKLGASLLNREGWHLWEYVHFNLTPDL